MNVEMKPYPYGTCVCLDKFLGIASISCMLNIKGVPHGIPHNLYDWCFHTLQRQPYQLNLFQASRESWTNYLMEPQGALHTLLIDILYSHANIWLAGFM